MSLDICVAHSQGGIAYLLMQALENALREAEQRRHVACLLTQVEVDPDDPAFTNPTKPIGPFFTEEEADAIGAELGWLMREDAGPRLAPRRALAEAEAHLRHLAGRGAGASGASWSSPAAAAASPWCAGRRASAPASPR